MNDRVKVAQLMVAVHLIPRELADYHVARMDDAAIAFRLAMYARQGIQSSEMELSAVGPQTRVANVRSSRFSRPTTMTAGLRRSILFPSSRPSKRQRGRRLPDSEVKQPAPIAARALSAGR